MQVWWPALTLIGLTHHSNCENIQFKETWNLTSYIFIEYIYVGKVNIKRVLFTISQTLISAEIYGNYVIHISS